MRSRFLVAIVLALLLLPGIAQSDPTTTARAAVRADLVAKSEDVGGRGDSTAWFEPNHGQQASDVQFTFRGRSYIAFITISEIIFMLKSESRSTSNLDPLALAGPAEFEVVRIEFVGVNPNARPRGGDTLPGVEHYFLNGKAVSGVPRFASVSIAEAWPGISIEFYPSNGNLEFDFVIRPRANPSDIRFAAHDSSTSITGEGLQLGASDRGLLLSTPVAYTVQGSEYIPVGAVYRTLPGAFGLSVSSYDPDHWLVIDPVAIAYGTYIGGTGNDGRHEKGIARSASATFLTGSTWSPDFPGSDDELAGDYDIFVTALSPSGSLLWTSFLGGSGGEVGVGVSVLQSGEVVVVGSTNSPDFPLVQAFEGRRRGPNDGFMVILAASGEQIEFSTYLGGSDAEVAHAVAIGPDGAIHVVGATISPDFPIKDAVQPTIGGGPDAFVMVFTPDLSLDRSTYLGGSKSDGGYDVALTSAGELVVAGTTSSPDFPSVFGLQPYRGERDTFVTRLEQDGRIAFSSTFGGTGDDSIVNGLSVAPGGILVAGMTTSPDLPIKNSFQANKNGGFDAFLLHLSLDDDILLSTYLGGSGDDLATGIAVDGFGRAILVGRTASADFPVVDGLDAAGSGSDGFVSVIDPDVGELVLSTRYGGSGSDAFWAAAAGGRDVIVLGSTDSQDMPTQNATQAHNAGGVDIVVLRLVFPRVEGVSGTLTLDQAPPCFLEPVLCAGVLGFSDMRSILPGSKRVFGVALGGFSAHGGRDCGADCMYWLDFAGSISGTTLTSEGSDLTVATLKWQADDGSWQPPVGIPLTATVRFDWEAGTPSLDMPLRVMIPAASLSAASGTGVARFQMEAATDQHSGEDWTLDIDAAQIQLVARPVVMVHGWTSEPDSEDYSVDSGQWQTILGQYLRERAVASTGQDPWEIHGSEGVTWFSYNKKDDFRNSAGRELLAQISRVQGRTDYSGPVDIVAHSMGGLVSRYLVEPSGLNLGSDVAHIVTLNTPHLGSILADANVRKNDFVRQEGGVPGRDRYYIGNDGRNVGIYDSSCDTGCPGVWREWWRADIEANRFAANPGASIPVMADFELKHVDGEDGNPILDDLNAGGRTVDVRYMLVAGNSAITLRGPFGATIPLRLPGDGVVSRSSSWMGEESQGCKMQVDIEAPPILAHNAVTTDADVLGATFQFLSGDGSPCADGASARAQGAASLSRAGAEWVAAGLRTGNGPTVLADAGTIGSWFVDRVDNATFVVVAEDGLNLEDLRITSPSGQVSTSSSGASNVYWSGPQVNMSSTFVVVHVERPENGTWVMDAPGADNRFVMPLALLQSPYSLDTKYPRPMAIGSTVPIEVSLGGPDGPLLDAIVTGAITPSLTSIPEELQFRDDGMEGDSAANDGVHTALLAVRSPGLHRLHVEATSSVVARTLDRGIPVLASSMEVESACPLALADESILPAASDPAAPAWLASCATSFAAR